MDTRDNQSFRHTPVALGALTASAYAAGFSMIAAWFVLLVLDQAPAAIAPRTISISCGACGMVETVREIAPAPRQALEGGRAEAVTLPFASAAPAVLQAGRIPTPVPQAGPAW